MIKFNKTTLDAEMVCGDTGTFSFCPKINEEIVLKEGDEVWFTVKKIQSKEVVLERKVINFENGIAVIELEPEATKNLEPDNYIYDLKMIRGDGNIDTLIPNRPYAYFSLKKGVKEYE